MAHGRWSIAWRERCFYGATDLGAWAAFIKAIDPEGEIGLRLARHL